MTESSESATTSEHSAGGHSGPLPTERLFSFFAGVTLTLTIVLGAMVYATTGWPQAGIVWGGQAAISGLALFIMGLMRKRS